MKYGCNACRRAKEVKSVAHGGFPAGHVMSDGAATFTLTSIKN